jgi:hypothetical protein
MGNFIKTNIIEYLKENYSNRIKFDTEGDYSIEIKDLNTKLDIINKYFPFNNVTGYYDTSIGVELFFDNDIKIKGVFKEEPFNVDMFIGDNTYTIDIHRFGDMGGFDNDSFENDIKLIHNEEDVISLVIGHEGDAIKSYTFKKSESDDYKVYLVNGTQIEGKPLGKTINGKKSYKQI